ncbi:MAG: hypothetical protein H5T97_11205, partial [Firmicutes bacterium]|nr:hypothetical protein [Bacillota bacterium]
RAEEAGQYSLVRVFYRVHPRTYPCTFGCYLVVGWYGDSGRHSFGLRFLDPNRLVLWEMPPRPLVLGPEIPYANLIVRLQGLTLHREGRHWFQVLLDGTVHAEFPMDVTGGAPGPVC